MKNRYPDRESKSLEFKSKIPPFRSLIKTCVAFANGIGGKIIIGVDDKTLKIVGIDDSIRDRIYDEFTNSLYDATSPSMLVEVYEQRFGEQSVMIIDIPYSIKKPVFIKSEGIPNGVYLRAGSNTRKANKEYVEELMRENQCRYYDEEMINADVGILSQTLLKKVFSRIDNERLMGEKIICRSTTNSKKYCPTVAGILAFCEMPDSYIPEALVICTKFQGREGRTIIQTEEIRGHLDKQIEDSFALIRAWLMRDYRLIGTKLKGKTIIPEEALREVITNALIHRKYWIPGAVKIALYDDRLEIFSPGNFPGLFNLQHLGDGSTFLRNPHIAKLARRLGLIEKLGTGIKLILDSCNKAAIQKPEFIEGSDSVKVVFPFLPAQKATDTDQEQLFALFDFYNELKISEVESYLDVSRNTATRRLNQLIAQGKIRRLGKGPGVRYVLKEK